MEQYRVSATKESARKEQGTSFANHIFVVGYF